MAFVTYVFSTHGSNSTGNPLSINFPLFLHGISDGLSAFVLWPVEPGVGGPEVRGSMRGGGG